VTFLSDKSRKIISYLQHLFPVILLFYPLKHIRVGAEWWDTGYNYGNFVYMDHMDEMWLFSTYLGNVVGNFFSKLPFGDSMVGMNVYTGLVVSVLALGAYYFFVKCVKLPPLVCFLGEFLAISLCWCPTALLYNYLTYGLMGAGYVLLYKALLAQEKESRLYFVLAGIVLGVNVYARFSNLAQMALVVAVWAMGIIRREKFGKVVKQTLWCILGYVMGLGGVFVWIALRYGGGTYMEAIMRLLGMPAEASQYTILSMVVAQYQNYLQNLIWLGYFAGFVMIGLVIYALFPEKIKWIAKIGYIGGCLLLFYYLCNMRQPNMFNLKYSTKMSVYQWAVMLLTATMIIGLIVIFSKRFTEQEKLLCGMNMIVLVITPLGSNNHLYSSINNLFFAAPFTLWMLWRFFRWLPGKWRLPLLKGKALCKKGLDLYPVKAMLACMICMIFVQSALFGWFYVFSEGDGGENLHTKIENSDILKGMLTSPDRAEAIGTISDYVNENQLKGREILLYGQIPAMSYYLEMPFAISAWPDLASYNYQIMEEDLAEIEKQVAEGEKNLPVMLLEIRQGSYLTAGEFGLRQLGLEDGSIDNIAADKKLQLLKEFAEKHGYEKCFENTKFMMLQADAERREKK